MRARKKCACSCTKCHCEELYALLQKDDSFEDEKVDIPNAQSCCCKDCCSASSLLEVYDFRITFGTFGIRYVEVRVFLEWGNQYILITHSVEIETLESILRNIAGVLNVEIDLPKVECIYGRCLIICRV